MHKHKNITLSLPIDLNILLHQRIPKRNMSLYVANALRKSLEEDEHLEQQQLEAAYEAADRDRERVQFVEEWQSFDQADNIQNWIWDDE